MREQRLHEMIRAERRAQGITQSELALAVGCKQSAVSMYEAGRAGTLSKTAIKKMAEHLAIDVETIEVLGRGTAPLERVLKYCPVDECPSNIPYLVRGDVVFRPQMVRMPRQKRSICPWCGELLLDSCPNPDCGAALSPASFCDECSLPYVTPCTGGAVKDGWIAGRQKEIQFLLECKGGRDGS